MEGGFTFDGVDIATLGLEYAPDNGSTYVWHPGTYNIHEQTFDAHDGGYYYGLTMKPKDFTLRCFYTDTHISSGIMTRIHSVFRRGKTGKLVFAHRPWCWYMATVTKVDASQMMSFVNGLVTITVRAYYPFARSDQTRILDDDPNEEDLLANSAMIKSDAWDLGKDFAVDSPITSGKSIALYNPGTERCPVAIEIAGDVGDGVTIYNANTKQSCKIVALSKALSTNVNKYLVLDSLSGKVLLTDGSSAEYAYLYHDNGFIDLETNYPIDRGVHLTGTEGEQYLYSDTVLDQSYVGRYVALSMDGTSGYLGSGTLGNLILSNTTSTEGIYTAKITQIEETESGSKLSLSARLPTTVNAKATIAVLNEIQITPVSDMELTRLVFRYSPTFS